MELAEKMTGADREAQRRPGVVMGVVVERSRTHTQRPPLYDYIVRVSIRRAAQTQDADTSLVVKVKRFLRGEHPLRIACMFDVLRYRFTRQHARRNQDSQPADASLGDYVALSKMASDNCDGSCGTVQ
jgi:hypothetical protein